MSCSGFSRPAVRPLAILGTGHALPMRRVTSLELDQKTGRRPGSVERIGGVRQRYFAEATETAATLGAEAVRYAMDAACLRFEEIDCLVAASGTMDQGMPSNAALIHRELGKQARDIPAFDINASCLGFITALETLSWPIIAGHYRRVVIVSSDIASCGLDWSKLEASAIFGDGAAAAVIGLPGAQQTSRILASGMRVLSQGADLCRIQGGGSRYHPNRTDKPFSPLTLFTMNGKGVFKLVATHLPSFLNELLAKAGLDRDAIDWVVPHQASDLALQHIIKRLGFKKERMIDIFAEHGNQVAASLPTALDCAIRSGKIKRGQRLLLLGTGAGVTMGAMVIEY